MRRICAFAFPFFLILPGAARADAIDRLVIPGIGPPSSQPVPARRAAGGGLGGGLLEMIVTGGNPAVSASAPSILGAASPAPIVMAAPQRRRLAALAPTGELVAAEPSEEYRRQEVDYSGPERPGTIIIDTPRKFLFLVQPGGRALRYGIGVGRPGFEWSGVKWISRKAEWPGWTPPPEMLLRRPDLPRHMDGGPDNPLGARALYLGSSMYRIHGTNEPATIGQNVSSGCIRMMNEDVIDLYDRVPVGAKAIVM
jgi:lipoprotein-anchoring transpeptidase ErfK/SrfK